MSGFRRQACTSYRCNACNACKNTAGSFTERIDGVHPTTGNHQIGGSRNCFIIGQEVYDVYEYWVLGYKCVLLYRPTVVLIVRRSKRSVVLQTRSRVCTSLTPYPGVIATSTPCHVFASLYTIKLYNQISSIPSHSFFWPGSACFWSLH